MKKFIQRIKNWLFSMLFNEDYVIACDWGLRGSEILIIKYSNKTGEIEVVGERIDKQSAHIYALEKTIRQLAKDYKTTNIIRDYPAGLRHIYKGGLM